ncbi:MAG: DUF2927 domain-containing protein [Silicimonas sp.]|nr:DUF2927 domain-containing protein [Silicimonas sp.]
MAWGPMRVKAFRPDAPMRRAIGSVALALMLGACDPVAAPVPMPKPRPASLAPSPESLALSSYYTKVETGHRSRGLLRTDGGGPDTPFDAERLAAAFEATAFSREFSDRGAGLVDGTTASTLHRWDGPVRLEVMFGASVRDGQRADDKAAVARYGDRLARVTRHPIRTVARGGNFHVLVLSDEERRNVGPLLTRLIPRIRPREIDFIEKLDRGHYCIVLTSAPQEDGRLTRAVALIRAELPPLLRLSCIHEEIAQGLGLANDSDRARPSIFNDDDEFGRLTGMDEKMLRMLYDLRLQPGMTSDEAMPRVRAMARELTGQSL